MESLKVRLDNLHWAFKDILNFRMPESTLAMKSAGRASVPRALHAQQCQDDVGQGSDELNSGEGAGAPGGEGPGWQCHPLGLGHRPGGLRGLGQPGPGTGHVP